METIIDEEKKITHSKFSEEIDNFLTNPKSLKKIKAPEEVFIHSFYRFEIIYRLNFFLFFFYERYQPITLIGHILQLFNQVEFMIFVLQQLQMMMSCILELLSFLLELDTNLSVEIWQELFLSHQQKLISFFLSFFLF